MGDEMDAMIPEREMKVRDRPGPPRLRESWSCLGAPPLPAAPPVRRLQIARLAERPQLCACRGREFPPSAGHLSLGGFVHAF